MSQMPKRPGDKGEIGLIDLLAINYFRRRWVVQELLLSRRVVIRVGDAEYWIDSTDGADTPNAEWGWENNPDIGWRWEATPAPWFRYAAKGHFIRDMRKEGCGSLFEMMLATEKSLGKDPRDKVFGVLALAQAIVRHQYSIRADYSLSLQHIMIGAFAQCLVVDKDPGLIWAACGIQGWDHYPS